MRQYISETQYQVHPNGKRHESAVASPQQHSSPRCMLALGPARIWKATHETCAGGVCPGEAGKESAYLEI